ncbi:hypothetical protein RCL_jg20826.t1 [Rhizophagus clarus]|uniref:Uncharacterized protein n=1 Tax=Rhizophagus clarus TaxID=94130 RepID=A0A8H3QPE3_9GLOM|nr:hypothetical protein RCL_jg20826.t1 [Rhizophagus clarus]
MKKEQNACSFVCTLESAIALSQRVRENVTKSGQVEKQDAPIIAEDTNALMDIEISPLEANQSTSNTMPIIKDLPDESTDKANQSAKSPLDPSAKPFTPPTRTEHAGDEILIPPPEKKTKSDDKPNTRKVVKNEASTVITGYQPAHNSQAFVRDIIVYDIPAKWDNYTIINALSA